MIIPLIPPRGNTAKISTYTGPLGSLTVNTDTSTVHVHDGATPGGQALSKVGHIHAFNEVTNWLGYTPAALGSDGKVLSSQLPVGNGGSTGPNLSLSPGSRGASYNENSGVLNLDNISGPLYGLTALIDATTTALTVAVGGTLTASTFSGNGEGLTNLPADQLTTGIVPTIVLGSGTADNTTFLRGDGVWISIAAGANLVAGDIINALGYTPAVLVNGILDNAQLQVTTDDVLEGVKQYFTPARAWAALSIVPGASGVTYTNGVFDFSQLSGSGGTSESIIAALGYTPAQIDPATSKVLASQLPKITLNNTYSAASETAMLALPAVKGDVAIRSDEQDTYVLTADDPTVLANWVQLPNPAGTVVSVNGQTGASISLTTSDIPEGSRLYFTPARAQAAISIVAGTTGVKYTGGVLDLTALESSASIITAVGPVPTPEPTLPGIYGGANGSVAQLYMVASGAGSGYKIWGVYANGTGMHMGTYQDDVTGFTGMLSMNPSSQSISLNAGYGGVHINGDLNVSGGTFGVTASEFHGQFWGDGYNITGLQANHLATGTVSSARLGSGTANSTTILYGDGVWRVAPPGDGSLTLSNVTSYARAAVSINAGASGITYNQTSGVFDFSGIVVGLHTVNNQSSGSGIITLTTGDIAEGGSNKYYTDARARLALSLTPGTSGATYDSVTGILDLSQLQGTTGTVTSVSVASANGVSGTVTNPNSTPVLTIQLGDIVPTSVNASGNVKGATVTSTGTLQANGNVNINGDLTFGTNSTITGGSFSAKITPRVSTTSGGTSFAAPSDTCDQFEVASISTAFTIANPTGTPVDGQKLLQKFSDAGTAVAISWGNLYNPCGCALPLYTVAGKPFYVECVYNSATSKWDVKGIFVSGIGGYEIPLSITGTVASGAKVLNFIVTRPFTLPASLTGSFAKAGTAAAAACAFTIFKNGTSLGTINFASGATSGTFTFTTATPFAVGDLMTMTASTADTALADIAINLMGA